MTGILKYDSLSNFFDSLIAGTADLDELNEAAAQEEFIPDPEELEIEAQQEAEMLKLAHGGFSNMIDFEAAVRDGSAKNFHQANGYPGMMGGAAPHGAGAAPGKEEEKEKKVMKDSDDKDSSMPYTEKAEQVVMDAKTEAASATGKADAKATPVSEPEPEVEEAAAADELVDDEFVENVPEPEPIVASESVSAGEATATHTKDEL